MTEATGLQLVGLKAADQDEGVDYHESYAKSSVSELSAQPSDFRESVAGFAGENGVPEKD